MRQFANSLIDKLTNRQIEESTHQLIIIMDWFFNLMTNHESVAYTVIIYTIACILLLRMVNKLFEASFLVL